MINSNLGDQRKFNGNFDCNLEGSPIRPTDFGKSIFSQSPKDSHFANENNEAQKG